MLIRNYLKRISKEKIIALLFTPILLLNAAQSHAERINILQDTWHFSVFNLNVLEHLQPGQNIPHSNSFEIDFPVFYFEEGMASYLGSMLTASFSAESFRPTTSPNKLIGGSDIGFYYEVYSTYSDHDYVKSSKTIRIQTDTKTHPAGNFQTNHHIINAQGFTVNTFINPQYDWWGGSVSLGSAIAYSYYTATHGFDVKKDSSLAKASDFFIDVEKDGVKKSIAERKIDEAASSHINTEISKQVTLHDSGLTNPGTLQTVGTEIYTASPGELVYNIAFSDTAENIHIPFVFEENSLLSTLDIYFNTLLLASVQGKNYAENVLNFIEVDVSSYQNQSGLLRFVLNTTSDFRAGVYIPEGIFKVAAVPEPESYALLTLGLGLIGFSRRIRVTLAPAAKC